MTEIAVTVRKAIPDDSEEILRVVKIIGGQTPYLVMDERGMALSTEDMRENLANLYESANNVFLVALAEGTIVGTANVKATYKKRMEHIGEIGISVLKDYWGIGLGTLLMEELIVWAKQTGIIRRLELTVQQRNKRAVHVYEKMGFKTEAIMPRGAKTDTGEFLDVRLMSKMID